MPGVLTKIVEGAGRLVSYLTGILVLVIVLQVVLRYVFARGLVSLEELEWHLWAVGLIFGVSYCLLTDTDIRMDLIYRRYSPRFRAWLDLLALLFLVVPFVIIIFYHGWDFTHTAWRLGEGSDAPNGLPFRWLIKSTIPIGLLLMGMALVVRIWKHIEFIRKAKIDGTE